MEQVYFYQKIVSVLGDGSFMTRKKGVGKLMQMMMLSQMMKGGEETHAGLPGTLTQLLLMKSLGAGDLFEGLEDAFDGDEEDEKAEEDAA